VAAERYGLACEKCNLNKINLKSLVFLFLFCSSAFCQTGEINGHINLKDLSLDYKYILVYAMQKDSVVSGSTLTESGDFKIANIKYGNYKIKIAQLGARDYFKEVALNSSSISINIDYPNCPFAPKGKKPKCPLGHSNNIVPTIYGKPFDKTRQKANKGLIHLGGCEVYADCNSYYFCKIHNKEL
jgi:hypothetical protein